MRRGLLAIAAAAAVLCLISAPTACYLSRGAWEEAKILSRREARSLADDGLDVYVRPSDAFSTLGFFNDPLLNTTLKGDSIGLANTVIHELTHNTFYASGQAPFNESFAMFVGARGGAGFFRSRGQEPAAAKVEAEWEDDKLLARFWARVIKSLDSAYRMHPESREA